MSSFEVDDNGFDTAAASSDSSNSSVAKVSPPSMKKVPTFPKIPKVPQVSPAPKVVFGKGVKTEIPDTSLARVQYQLNRLIEMNRTAKINYKQQAAELLQKIK